MSTVSNYMFNNLGRIGADATDNTQKTLQNTRFANYSLSNYFSESLSNSHVQFATAHPTMMVQNSGGVGISGAAIDVDSRLMLGKEQERPLEKLQLMQRAFSTVPYLGRGSCDPSLESQLQQGEVVAGKKSVSTVMEKSFMGYTLYPADEKMTDRVKNPAYSVEESALDGWVRGGMASRDMTTDANFSKKHRPTDSGY